MLPPQALRPLLRYFTAIDTALAERFNRTVPFDEPGLTSLLCDLMDDEHQRGYKLDRDADWVRRKLASAVPLTRVEISIETHQYPKTVENQVTQSDLGIVLQFRDDMNPERGWTRAHLLQAKRVFPLPGGAYGLGSKFASTSSKTQYDRIKGLNRLFGRDFVHYLLYTPRPEQLDTQSAAALRALRDANLTEDLFDRTLGLELHRQLRKTKRDIDAGVMVAPVQPKPSSYRAAYRDLFNRSLPWSWFLVWPYFEEGGGRHGRPDLTSAQTLGFPSPQAALNERMVRLVSGNMAEVADVLGELDWDVDEDPPFLPARSITVMVTAGAPDGWDDLVDDDPDRPDDRAARR